MSSVVGREPELRAIEAFLATGEGGALLAVLGEPGIGKTTVWQEAVAGVRARGATVLVSRPAESESRLSFAGLADLLSRVPADLFTALPDPQRAGLEAALLRFAPSRPPERRVVAAGFLSLLTALSLDAPVVVAVDDLQWLDAPSFAVVEFALRRVAGERVCALLSMRTDAAERLLAPLEREQRVERVELGPLSVAALHRILADALGHTFSRPVLVRLAQASGGNPLYAIEVARRLDRDGTQPDAGGVPVPDSLHALVRTRVRALPQRTRDALLRAAALARPDTGTVEPADLAAAEEARLVRIERDGRIHFVHPLFASAVYSSAALSRRRAAHRALVDAVTDPVERARHLALAATGPDGAVVRELEAAAVHARRRGAPDAAAELIELAIRLVPAGDPAVHRLRLELAEHLFLGSDFPRARALLGQLRTELDGDDRARALLLLAEIEYWRQGESAALGLAEDALTAAKRPEQRARCQTAIAMYAGTVDLTRAAAAARAAVELLERRPRSDPGLLASALSAGVRATLFLGEGFDADAAERALELEAPAPPPGVDTRVGFKLSQVLRYVDDFDGARERLAESERQARDEGDESSLGNILLNQVILETWAGNWSEAAALTERMRDAFSQQGVESEGIAPWLAYVDAYAGRLEHVRATAGPRPAEPVIAAIWCRCHGLAELAAGDAASADRHLSDSVAGFDRVDFREPAIWRVDGDAIEAAVATGALDRAEAWVVRFEERAARSRIPWSVAVSARCRGLLLAAGGELGAAAAVLEHARAAHDRCPMPFECARTQLVQGQVLRRLKRKRQARSALEAAGAIFAQLGADTWVARVETELRRVAARRAPEELSATELRIAQLAAGGLSNPEIAAQVFVSRKTVEANLGRAYRKLGITSRAQLDRALREAAETIS